MNTATQGVTADSSIDTDGIFKKAAFRLIPFLFFCYVLNYIDRVNVSFAHLQFKSDLGLSETAYGFGVGVFYVGYVLFEVPSNLLLRRIGARKTIARIMVLWGLVSLSMLFVQNQTQFFIARIALGIAEAGFFPGIIYYLSSWFPARHRARVMSLFVLGIAVAGITGGPISGWILGHAEGWESLRAWQWLFLLEGLPPVFVGLVALWYIPDSPATASWLSSTERAIVERELALTSVVGTTPYRFGDALCNPKLYICAFGYFSITWAGSVLNFWSPAIIRESGIAAPVSIGLLSAVPYAVGALAMVLASRHSDAKDERVRHFGCLALVAALGALGLSYFHGNFTPAMICLVFLAIGYLSCTAIFWTIPSTFLAGTASAGSIALISSVGQLGSLTAPMLIGCLTTRTHQIGGGLLLASAVLAGGGVTVAALIPARTRIDHA
ncbi:MFS transporter [Burkholderia multivorans]|uniref:MFS transporter n=1 Tax=Burkholderia multivorans TaxID=87883 RepID=A0AAP2HSG5_9BURK|nr:MFS transporter [Burkholderia multivorans]MBU9360739.1 MFS transporter [Burkholderia multivorans]MBU9366691.1 MFS transporter [Burkholderia multivorans]MBU9598416.1 MFS transporter [Burkholderia multivorans]MCA8485860.1 MFS transporter [Burkholderia multivorans]